MKTVTSGNQQRCSNRETVAFLGVGLLLVSLWSYVAIRRFIASDWYWGFQWDHNFPVLFCKQISNLFRNYLSVFDFKDFPGRSNYYNRSIQLTLFPFVSIIILKSFKIGINQLNSVLFFLYQTVLFISTFFSLSIYSKLFRKNNSLLLILAASLVLCTCAGSIGFFLSGSYPVIQSIALTPFALLFTLIAYQKPSFKWLCISLLSFFFLTIHYWSILILFLLILLIKKKEFKLALLSMIVWFLLNIYWAYPVAANMLSNDSVIAQKSYSSFGGPSILYTLSLLGFTHGLFTGIMSNLQLAVQLISVIGICLVIALQRTCLHTKSKVPVLVFLFFLFLYSGYPNNGSLISIFSKLAFKSGLFFIHRGYSFFSFSAFLAFVFMAVDAGKKYQPIVIVFLFILFVNQSLLSLPGGDLGLNVRRNNRIQAGTLNVLEVTPKELKNVVNREGIEHSVILTFPPMLSAVIKGKVFSTETDGIDNISSNDTNQYITTATPKLIMQLNHCLDNEDKSCFEKVLSATPANFIEISKIRSLPVSHKYYRDNRLLRQLFGRWFGKPIVNDFIQTLWPIKNTMFEILELNQIDSVSHNRNMIFSNWDELASFLSANNIKKITYDGKKWHVLLDATNQPCLLVMKQYSKAFDACDSKSMVCLKKVKIFLPDGASYAAWEIPNGKIREFTIYEVKPWYAYLQLFSYIFGAFLIFAVFISHYIKSRCQWDFFLYHFWENKSVPPGRL